MKTRPTEMTSRPPISILFGTGCLFDESSGPYHSVMQTVRALDERGHHLTVVGTCPKHRSKHPEWGVHALAFTRYGPDSLHFAPGLSRWLLGCQNTWDVVSLQSVWMYVHHALANWCLRNRKPYMITVRGNFNPVALRISSWKKWVARHTFLRETLKNAFCYQALTETEYRTLREYGVRQPVCIIGNGVKLPDLEHQPPADALIPEELRSRRTVLYLGRLHPIKGIDRLLRAWGRLPPSDSWQLVIAGEGHPEYRARLEELAKGTGRAAIHFIGPVRGELKTAWLQHSELFVLPSRSEGLAMATLEAFSHAVPALITTECGFPEAAHAGAALIVASNEEGIENGLSRLLNMSKAQRHAMGQRALAFVRDRYDWSTVCADLEAVYGWMRGAAQPPDCVRFD